MRWAVRSGSTNPRLKPMGPDVFQNSIFSEFKKVIPDLLHIRTIIPLVGLRQQPINKHTDIPAANT